MYSDIPTDALYQMLESPGELMSGEEIVRLRDEHGVDISQEIDVEDVNCGIEIPHSVLQNPDPEVCHNNCRDSTSKVVNCFSNM